MHGQVGAWMYGMGFVGVCTSTPRHVNVIKLINYSFLFL
jgi:hypothetical protein